MATLIQSAYVEAAYEDMFKEITRKLYGEETGNGLHTLGTPVAQVATSGPTAPEGERSFTNLVRLPIDRSVVAPTIEYDHNNGGAGGNGNGGGGAGQPDTSAATTSAGNFKSEDQLSTAFGLAALMQQNGFTSGGTILGAQTIQKTVNPSTSNSNVVGNAGGEARWTGAIPVTVPSGADEIVQWPTSGKLGSYNGTLKAAKPAKVRDPPNEIYTSPTSVVTNNNNTTSNSNTPSVVQHSQQHVVSTPTTSTSNSRKKNAAAAAAAAAANQQNAQLQIPKRYACTHCPYSTDRRDLYTRHENIHKDEKPFQCYACLKQFNRADHVKKHFLRMHREMVYDINKTRRNVPSTVSTQQQQHQQQTHQIDQKPNIFLQQQVGGQAGVVHAENFMTGQRQETSSSLSIAQTIESVATATHTETMPVLKQEKNTGDDITGTGQVKVKREKRFTCCYCPWSGADKWGLKRHLNTHTKPFVCMLCDYKAARSERLATHVLKVHNKKACNKCSFLADNQEEYLAHMNDVHPLDPRSGRNHSDNVIRPNLNNNINNNNNNNNSNLNVLRTIGNTLVSNNNNNNQSNNFQNPSTSFGAQSTANSSNNSGVNSYTTTDLNGSNNAMNNGNAGPLQEIMVNPTSMVGWRLSANGSLIPPHDLITGGLSVNANQKRGAERLFQYLEADGSDPEDYARLLKMDAMSRNTASVAQDFHKAGGVDLKNKHQFFNNNTTTSKHAAASLLHNNKHQNQNNHQQQQRQQRNKQTNHNLRQKGFSSCGSTSDETEEDYENMENIENFNSSSDQRKAMSAFLSRNFGLQEKIHPIPLINNNDNIKMEKAEIKIKEEPIIKNQPKPTSSPPLTQLPPRKRHSVDSIKQQPMKSPPAQPINLTNNKKKNNNNNINQLKANVKQNNNTTNHSRKSSVTTTTETKIPVINNNNNNNNNSTLKGHRLDLIRDKENSNSIFSTMEYQNLSKFGTQFQNYVKDIINKYYAETPLLFPIVPHQQHLHHNVQQQQQPLSPPPSKRQKLSETEEYIEYLKNKEDITLTITPKINNHNNNNNSTKTANINYNNNSTKNQFNSNNNNKIINNQTRPAVIVKQSRTPPPPRIIEEEPKVQVIPVINYAHGNLQSLVNGNTFYPSLPSLKPSNNIVHQFSDDDNSAPIDMSSNSAIYDSRRSNRKQAQPKKIKTSPEVVMAQLRDKYLKKMVDRKKSCVDCTNNNRKSMLVFPYHTPASLRLHRLWKHSERSQNCGHCNARFSKMYSLKVHCRLVHRK